uniref:Uncharacterized protein n=1 Tax=Anguilla anguilla TaxID=7936 RepID=A0A0E9V5D6_ANGAN
MQTRKSTHL